MESYPVHWIRYCNWLWYLRHSWTVESCDSSSPTSSTWGGSTTCWPFIGSSTTRSIQDTSWRLWIHIEARTSRWSAYGETRRTTINCPNRFQSNFCVGLVVSICPASSHTRGASCMFDAGVQDWFPPSSYIAWLWFIATRRGSWIVSIVACSESASNRWWS